MTIVHVNDETNIVVSPPFPRQVVPFVQYLSQFSNNEWSSRVNNMNNKMFIPNILGIKCPQDLI
jgi:hypothetical protein